MATYGRTVRRGLPRVTGGEPWPPAGAAPVEVVDAVAAPDAAAGAPAEVVPVAPAAPAAVEAVPVAAADVVASEPAPARDATPAPASSAHALRRGLPRVPGGEPWPPAGAAPAAPAASASAPAPAASAAPVSLVAGVDAEHRAEATLEQPVAPVPVAAGDGVALRRGLPRTVGGEPWPPEGVAHPAVATVDAATTDAGAVVAAPAAAATAAESAPAAAPATASAPASAAAPATATAPAAAPAASDTTTTGAPAPAAAATATTAVAAGGPRPPLTVPRTVWPGVAASRRPAPKPEPTRIGPFTRGQWAGVVIVGGGGLLVAAALAVFFVRWFLSLDFMQAFLVTYPGEYHLPEGAPVGFPAWLGWQHFFNAFFMVLIIRTGLQVRTEKRPAVFWTPRGDKKGKTSLTIWLHQSLDILWMANGLIFLVLLFVTGQWMRIVPTSWEVLPNALSAALQYVSLDWPTENGWVNYNGLQQLAYFATVFIAAPLAIITGYRMSGLWPKQNARLNKAYPIEWARTVHFPVMLYFVAFIIVHVTLVFATGALRNLNHMYAAQGSVDGVAYADNWAGFWIFIASLVVMAGGWIAARPLVVAPIARLFGTVSGR